MKLLLEPVVFDLLEERFLMLLYKSFADGIFEQVCFEADSADSLQTLRGMLKGAANAQAAASNSNASQARVYRPGYDLYVQGRDGYIFVNPKPRPELFEGADLAAYIKEFAR